MEEMKPLALIKDLLLPGHPKLLMVWGRSAWLLCVLI
jgi:hypothetical protein